MRLRGEYSEFDENGLPIIYEYDDLVYFNKKAYAATRSTDLYHPLREGSGWSLIGTGASFFSGVEPQFTKSGDKWFDLSSGVMYTRLEQNDGVLYWIEL